MRNPLSLILALSFVLGAAIACGDEDDGENGAGGSSGTSGGAGKGGTAGSGTEGGSSGSAGASGSAGKGGSAGTGGSAGRGGSAGSAGEGGEAGGGQGGETSGGAGGGGGEGGEGTLCEALVNTAPSVGEVQRTGSLPTPQGGTITDGVYHMQPWDVYPPASASSSMRSLTLYVTGDRFEVVGTSSGGTPQRLSLIGEASGTELTLSNSGDCGGDPTPTVNFYTATPNTISLIRTDAERSRVETFAKACNEVTNDAPAVSEVQQSGTLPAPSGGTLQPGTYHLTSWEVYPPGTADTGATRSITLEVTDDTLVAVGGDAPGTSALRVSTTYTIAGANITLTHVCPGSQVEVIGYNATASPARIRFIRDNRVETYTRQ